MIFDVFECTAYKTAEKALAELQGSRRHPPQKMDFLQFFALI